MNIQSIILSNSIGCIILIVLMISSNLVRQRRLLSDRLFTLLTMLTASGCILEMASFIIDGQNFTGQPELAMTINTLLYLDNISSSFLWCLYVDLRFYSSKQHTGDLAAKLCVPYFIGVAGLIANLKGQFLFCIDSDGIYQRKVIGYIYYLIMAFYLISSLIMRFKYKNAAGSPRFFPIWMFILPIIAGTTAQMIFYGISLAWCSVAIGLVGIHMSLQNELAYIDPLTKLYNRNYLNHILNQITYNHDHMCGIMLDMDHFKHINDTFGHSEGDNALVETARLISSVSDKAVPIRFAGDEFILLFPNGSGSELDDTVSALRAAADEFNKSNKKPYDISFSIGTSIFDGSSDADSFLSEMDENMYEEKKIKHRKAAAV